MPDERKTGKALPGLPKRDPDFPQMRKIERIDEQLHEGRAIDMGADAKVAKRHAREHVREREGDESG